MRQKNGKSQLNGFLDAGSQVRGELHFEDTFRIDSRLSGKVVSTGDLYVGEQGQLEGEVRVGRLFITGKVINANVHAQRVEIAPGGQLRGEVSTPTLIISEGALFEGQARVVDRDTPAAAPAPTNVRAVSG